MSQEEKEIKLEELKTVINGESKPKKRYKIYDLYERKETIGYADTMREVYDIAHQRYKDTDGEAAVYYAELNTITNKYDFFRRHMLYENA